MIMQDNTRSLNVIQKQETLNPIDIQFMRDIITRMESATPDGKYGSRGLKYVEPNWDNRNSFDVEPLLREIGDLSAKIHELQAWRVEANNAMLDALIVIRAVLGDASNN